jgi:hypothetical protein
MGKLKDLTPNYKKLKPAFMELDTQYGIQESGQESSGSSIFSNISNRGRGETVFSVIGTGIRASAARDQRAKAGFGTIQDAIDWVHSQGSGTVFLPAGTYTVNTFLTLYSDITLLGNDDDDTIIDFNSGENYVYIDGSFGDEIYNVHIRNLQFKNSTDESNGAICFSNAKDCSVEDCYFTNNWDSGAGDGADIVIGGSFRILVNRCRSIDSGWLVKCTGSNLGNKITNNYSEDANDGFVNEAGDKAYIFGNHIRHYVGDAIKLTLDSTEATVLSNFFDPDSTTTGHAIYLDTVNTLISNNIFEGTPTNADHTVYLDSQVLENMIIGNHMYTNASGKYLVYMNSNCFRNMVRGNVMKSSGSSNGVYLSSTSDNNMVDENIFRLLSTDVSDNGAGNQQNDNMSV